jgi:hypothetical protein
MHKKNYKQLPLSLSRQPFILALLIRQYIEQINKDKLNNFMAQGLHEQVIVIPLVMQSLPLGTHLNHFSPVHTLIPQLL